MKKHSYYSGMNTQATILEQSSSRMRNLSTSSQSRVVSSRRVVHQSSRVKTPISNRPINNSLLSRTPTHRVSSQVRYRVTPKQVIVQEPLSASKTKPVHKMASSRVTERKNLLLQSQRYRSNIHDMKPLATSSVR